MICPMLHLPDVSKAADALLILITGGTGMGMAALQQASMEIRDEFKAGEHVVFGAHVDENMGDRVQITVLGATDLESGAPTCRIGEMVVIPLSESPDTRAGTASVSLLQSVATGSLGTTETESAATTSTVGWIKALRPTPNSIFSKPFISVERVVMIHRRPFGTTAWRGLTFRVASKTPTTGGSSLRKSPSGQ